MAAVDRLLQTLDLEVLDRDLFRGQTPKEPRTRVFGGQVAAQALVAACRTVEGRRAHSLHGYFLRPGDPAIPIIYDVDRIRDGRSFTTRRVVAIQRGEAIFSMAASFHVEEPGLTHQLDMPAAAGPEGIPSREERFREYAKELPDVFSRLLERERPIDERDLDPVHMVRPEPKRGEHLVWVRANGSLPDDPAVHQCVLAYASDLSLLDSALRPHGLSWADPHLMGASLDHAIWFHRPFRADEWLLFVQESPSAAGARGFNLGQIFTRDGVLVASVAQEGLIRLVSE
jgi:acyl-CoA thioesterase-2